MGVCVSFRAARLFFDRGWEILGGGNTGTIFLILDDLSIWTLTSGLVKASNLRDISFAVVVDLIKICPVG
jgi:hypothetical protein